VQGSRTQLNLNVQTNIIYQHDTLTSSRSVGTIKADIFYTMTLNVARFSSAVFPDPAFHINADPGPVPHQGDSNLRPMTYRPSRPPF
jgi:hypothetical protein